MKNRTIVITFALLGVVLVIAACAPRGEWGAGGEWFLMFSLVPVVSLVPIKERRRRWRSGYRKGLRNRA